MAAVKMNTAEKVQLAEFRCDGFAADMLVAVKSGGRVLYGTVHSSNAAVTTVHTYNPVIGEVVVNSWATRSVKPARFVA